MRRTVTGFVALGAATLLAQVIGFFVLAVIARRLGPQDVGSYSFALNLMGYFAIPANFGVTALATRELAQNPERVRPLLGEIVALQGVLCVIPYALLVALAPVLAADETSEGLIPIVGLTFTIEAASLVFVLFGYQRFTVMAMARAVGAITFAVLAVLFVHAGDTTPLAWIHLAGVAATSVITGVAVLRLSGRPELRAGARDLARRFRAGVPLGIAAVMISIYYTVDALLIGYLRSTEEVGQYAVAYRIPLGVLAFAALWGSVLFPHFSALAKRSRQEVREQIGYFASLALVASLPMLAGALVVGEQLIPGLFGDEFQRAGTPFIVLMFAAALVPFSINWGTSSVALGDERHQAIAVSIGAVVNLVANLFVVPAYGMTGAAVTTVCAEVVVFAYLIWRIKVLVGHPPLDLGRIARAAGATAVMVLVLVLAVPDSWTAGSKVAVGLVVFAACAAPLRLVRPDEIRALWRREPEVVADVDPSVEGAP
ncbi:MAG TPA: flippase [Solirubrobacteraceae bacterium]|jgi:O-antigen/teichoic acid export membrane protein